MPLTRCKCGTMTMNGIFCIFCTPNFLDRAGAGDVEEEEWGEEGYDILDPNNEKEED